MVHCSQTERANEIWWGKNIGYLFSAKNYIRYNEGA